MTEKRKRDAGDGAAIGHEEKKRVQKGFTVGPANLPDGTYKRKTQKIKGALIQRAQIKKDYARLKRQGKIPGGDRILPQPAAVEANVEEDQSEPSTVPHPDRQILINKEEEVSEQALEAAVQPRPRKPRKPKPVPFKREYDQAQQCKQEAEERRRAREEAEKERQTKFEERGRFRRAMAKARTGGPNGQRKLGRESKVLLEKVQRMVGGKRVDATVRSASLGRRLQ